jgi:hypothetical protein
VSNGDGPAEDWDQRVARLWDSFDEYEPAAFRAAVQALADERPKEDAAALFELASSNDSTGREAHAAPLYRRALAAGLTGVRRRRAVIQLASTLRNLGEADEAVVLLRAERERTSDDLDDAVVAFLALALVDTGHERAAAALALGALSRHLPRYNRSLASYAADLADR